MNFFDRFRKPVVARIPVGRVLYQFRALQDFWSNTFKSQYVTGSIYSVREGNELLATTVTKWIPQGKVEVI